MASDKLAPHELIEALQTMVRRCDDESHVGNRVMPFTREHWIKDKCRQCAARRREASRQARNARRCEAGVPALPGGDEGVLRHTYVEPSLTILDAQAAPWIRRRRAWLDAGLASLEGRSDRLIFKSDALNEANLTSGSSVFDPVLTELLLGWYAPRPELCGAREVVVLDPFAGGSVRGVVASRLGFRYVGVELSAVQVDANRQNAREMCGACAHAPTWIRGDAREADRHLRDALGADALADVVLTCPPYYDLEVYSDDPADLSRCASFDAFAAALRQVAAAAARVLRPGHACVMVVGNARAADGELHDVHGAAKDAMRACGCKLYVDAILRTRLGSSPMRASLTTQAASKLVPVHQNVVVTCKGSVFTPAFCREHGIGASELWVDEQSAAPHAHARQHGEAAPVAGRGQLERTRAEAPNPHRIPPPPRAWCAPRRPPPPTAPAPAPPSPLPPEGRAAPPAPFASTEEWDAACHQSLRSQLLAGQKPRVCKPEPDQFATRELFDQARSWRACAMTAHEGCRIMPLDAEHFNTTYGRFTHCRQCKSRDIARRRAASRGETVVM